MLRSYGVINYYHLKVIILRHSKIAIERLIVPKDIRHWNSGLHQLRFKRLFHHQRLSTLTAYRCRVKFATISWRSICVDAPSPTAPSGMSVFVFFSSKARAAIKAFHAHCGIIAIKQQIRLAIIALKAYRGDLLQR